MKKILFSPLGGTDPISSTTLREGSFLHICRIYQPDKVYLYMSKEILAYHNQDNRYIYCLKQLEKDIEKTIDYEIIERPDLDKPNDFAFYYPDFSNIFTDISQEMHSGDELLLNVSSGTPQMKSALFVLKSIREYNFKCLQVSTPNRSMNEHRIERDLSIEELWEMNLDSIENTKESRIEEVECPWFIANKKYDLIGSQLATYDYSAALNIEKTMVTKTNGKYAKLIEAAACRKNLDLKGADYILKSIDEFQNKNFRPIKDEEKRKLYEYVLVMDTKRKNGEYADFIRSLTPFIAAQFKNIFSANVVIKGKKVDIKHYLTEDGEKWVDAKLNSSEIGQEIRLYLPERNDKFVYSETLKSLIERYACGKDEKKLINLVKTLRDIEKKIRNITAHQVVCVTDKNIYNKTGFDPDQIMDMVFESFKYTDYNQADLDWKSYDKMNENILAVMKEELR